MPIYEYQCAKCGHQIEVLQKVSDEPLSRCMACGEDTLNKLISATNFQLKGSGWYKASPTDTSGEGSAVKNSEANADKSTSDRNESGIANIKEPSEKMSAESRAGVQEAAEIKVSKDAKVSADAPKMSTSKKEE